MRVYVRSEMQFEKILSVRGHVKNELTIPYADSITLYDIVFRQAGLKTAFSAKKHIYHARIFIV